MIILPYTKNLNVHLDPIIHIYSQNNVKYKERNILRVEWQLSYNNESAHFIDGIP